MPKVLLVDDDPLHSFVRMSVLEQRFPNVQRVADAAEAFCLVEQSGFADDLGLVISGHHRPGISGPAFVAELRLRMPFLPILVLINGNETRGDYPTEPLHFLRKPVSNEEILSLVSVIMAQNERLIA